MMKVVIFFLLISFTCNSKSYHKPEVEQETVVFKNKIEYFFPSEINDLLKKEFSLKKAQNKYFIVLNHMDEGLIQLSLFEWKKSFPEDDLDKLIGLTNRYVAIEAYKTPIIFDTDLSFTKVGVAISNEGFRLVFRANTWSTKCEIISVSPSLVEPR